MRVYDDFSGNTPPAAPAGWTQVDYGTWTMDTAADSGHVIARDLEGSGSHNHLIVHAATGSIADASAQVLEIVVKWRFRAGETATNTAGQVWLLNGGSDFTGYAAGPVVPSSFRAYRWTADSNATLGGTTSVAAGFTFAVDTWYWTRFRRETNGIFKATVWPDGEAEPAPQWVAGSTDTTYTTGYLGVGGTSYQAEQDFGFIGIGIGETAPTAPIGSGLYYGYRPPISGYNWWQ